MAGPSLLLHAAGRYAECFVSQHAVLVTPTGKLLHLSGFA